MKAFFENPAQLAGAPLLVIGVIGIVVAVLVFISAPPTPATAHGPFVRRGVMHPTIEDYAGIVAIVLGLTVIEVLPFVLGIRRDIFVGILSGMTIVEIALVAMFVLHLTYDARMFRTTFLVRFGVVAAAAVIVVAAIVGSLV